MQRGRSRRLLESLFGDSWVLLWPEERLHLVSIDSLVPWLVHETLEVVLVEEATVSLVATNGQSVDANHLDHLLHVLDSFSLANLLGRQYILIIPKAWLLFGLTQVRGTGAPQLVLLSAGDRLLVARNTSCRLKKTRLIGAVLMHHMVYTVYVVDLFVVVTAVELLTVRHSLNALGYGDGLNCRCLPLV